MVKAVIRDNGEEKVINIHNAFSKNIPLEIESSIPYFDFLKEFYEDKHKKGEQDLADEEKDLLLNSLSYLTILEAKDSCIIS